MPRDIMTREEEARLKRLAEAGDKAARDRLILAHWPLCKHFANKLSYLPFTFEELFDEAQIHQIRAVDHWNPEGAARLGTFCAIFIRRGIFNFARDESARRRRLPTWTASALGADFQTLDWVPGSEDARSRLQIQARELVRSAVERLAPHKAELVSRVYGLDGHKPETVRAIAKDLGCTHAAVSKNVLRSLRSLNYHFRGRRLGWEDVAC